MNVAHFLTESNITAECLTKARKAACSSDSIIVLIWILLHLCYARAAHTHTQIQPSFTLCTYHGNPSITWCTCESGGKELPGLLSRYTPVSQSCDFAYIQQPLPKKCVSLNWLLQFSAFFDLFTHLLSPPPSHPLFLIFSIVLYIILDCLKIILSIEISMMVKENVLHFIGSF